MSSLASSATRTTTARRLQPRFDAKWLIIGACVALALYLGVVPLGFLLWQSFFTPQSATQAAELTLGNYREAYGSARTWTLWRTVALRPMTTSCTSRSSSD